MEIKRCTEKYLQESGLNYTIIRLCGFMQGLIGQYAVPILEEKAVWGTDAPTRIAYMDTQDIARMTLTAIRTEKTDKKILTFAGPRAWTTAEVISLCERLAGQDANVTTVPVGILRFTRQLTRFFQWTNDVADRLAFSEVLSSDVVFSAPMAETYSLLGVDPNDTNSLERYLQEYFSSILKKLKELKAQSKQGDFYIQNITEMLNRFSRSAFLHHTGIVIYVTVQPYSATMELTVANSILPPAANECWIQV